MSSVVMLGKNCSSCFSLCPKTTAAQSVLIKSCFSFSKFLWKLLIFPLSIISYIFFRNWTLHCVSGFPRLQIFPLLFYCQQFSRGLRNYFDEGGTEISEIKKNFIGIERHDLNQI